MSNTNKAEELAKEECVGNTLDCVHVKAFIKGYNSRQSEIDQLQEELDKVKKEITALTAVKAILEQRINKQNKNI